MKLITALRIKENLNKSQLARIANLSPSDIGKIESGRAIPYNSQLEKIAKALNYPANKKSQLIEEVNLSFNLNN